MITKIDACGKACPLPVIETKNALEQANISGTLEISVDNAIAVQNLLKLANHKKLESSSQMHNEHLYVVSIHLDRSKEGITPVPTAPPNTPTSDSIVVVLSSDTMGDGDEALGKLLMKGFLFALTQQEQLASTILLYNLGAKLSCSSSESLHDLKSLEAQGVEILTCGTCLTHYGLSDQLQVGTVTNMYEIVEKQMGASLIIKP